MAKKTTRAEQPAASATDALMRDVLKKQEIAKAVAISRAADFTGRSSSSPLRGGSDGEAGRGSGSTASSSAKKAPQPRSATQGSRIDRPHKGEGNPGIQRRPANAGREVSGQGVRVAVLPPAERISLRAPAGSVSALSKALGVKLPTKPKTSTTNGGRTALWLGPDEWLVIDEDGNDPRADCAKVSQLHSAVDISHRNVAISVVGPNCQGTISSGCPQDLSLAAFPVGACSRTILGKSEIVLLRTAEDAFRVECWRSFSDYVFVFLADAAKDAAA